MDKTLRVSLMALALSSCSMAPDFKLPEMEMPTSYKEQPAQTQAAMPETKGIWAPAVPLEKQDRGQWWKIFADQQLNDLEKQAQEANPSLQLAASRVDAARALAGAQRPSILPDLDIGGNALRAKFSDSQLTAFGAPVGTKSKPYTLYSAQGTASYEADLFGRVRDNYAALQSDADAQEAAYRSTLLALQADVAQTYFTLRALDTERQLLRDTVKVREEAARIMQRRFDVGEVGEQDRSRTQAELATVKADLLSVERSRATFEHALAVLLGKMPSNFMFAESPLVGDPPQIPAGVPSMLLARRPDVAQAVAGMASANARIGVARTAFFPRLILTASGGFESVELSDLLQWSSRNWALGQLAGAALTMPIFDSGRNLAALDAAHAEYDVSVAAYRQQVLAAFRDVEDALSAQQLLGGQSTEQDAAAAATARTTDLTEKRYQQGDADYFELVNAERDSLAAGRAAVQVKGARFIATVMLVRALGGDFAEAQPSEASGTKVSATPLLQ